MPEITIGTASGGIHNRSDKSRMPLSKNGNPTHVRNAVNLKLNNEGMFSSIAAPQQVFAGIALRDGYGCPGGMFFRQGSTVKKFTAPDQATAILEGVTGERIAWGYHQGIVYMSDGEICKKIYSDGSISNWGIVPPMEAPILSGTNRYGLGQIFACYTYVAADGRESGTSPVVISSVSGRTVSGILNSPDPQTVAVKVYMTEPDESTFFHAATILPGVASVEITQDYRANGLLYTKDKYNPPPCNIIRAFGAHILMAVNDVLWWTDEFSTDLVSLGEEVEGVVRDNFWRFPSEITVMEPVEGGVWIVADSTYFIAGKDVQAVEPVIVSENKGVKYTGLLNSDGNALWMSDAGECIGSPGGQLSKPQEPNVAVDRATTGAAIVMETNGTKMKITTLEEPEVNPLRNRDWEPFGKPSTQWETS